MNNNKITAAVGRTRIAAAVAILAALAAPGATLGQQPESVIVDVGACVNLKSPGERLDCYEEQVQRARAQASVSPPPPPAAVPPAVTLPAAAPPAAASPAAAPQVVAVPVPAAPSASPGAQASGRRVRVENARVASGGSSDDSEQYEGVITALRETVPNAWVVTLDNGQVWRQSYAKAYRLQVGQPVQISRVRGFGGGYRLTVVELAGFIQVDRVR
jgi:hypothetical protein